MVTDAPTFLRVLDNEGFERLIRADAVVAVLDEGDGLICIVERSGGYHSVVQSRATVFGAVLAGAGGREVDLRDPGELAALKARRGANSG